ncbi:MAG: hypothetical protein R3208_10655 [Ketobacteraceae bacterium]|nr:hypothetical protein [Ketobacteraceae bacterium]
MHHRNRGVTVIELLTVIALVCTVAVFVIGMVENTLRDTRIRAAIEQARQDLYLLEVIRQSSADDGLDINRQNKSSLVDQLPASLSQDISRILKAFQPQRFWPDYQLSETLYSVDNRKSSVIIRFPAADVSGLVIPHASATNMNVDDTAVTEFEIFSRDLSMNSFLYTRDHQLVKRFYGW